jgi:DNA repair exonuclease SbcCD ATPase subunit
MRLISLTLRNFRGFAQEQTVSLDGDVVVIWGPNGSGKTTLLDALQWLVLGDVPRLRRTALKPGEDVVTSRYATGVPYVSARIRDDDGAVTSFTRHGLGDSMRFSATIEETNLELSERDAQSSLALLLGRASLDEAGTAFGRTYLLQQDELTELLQADTKERYRFLAELTGLESLQSLDTQLQSELRQLRAAARERRGELEEADRSVQTARRSRQESATLATRHSAGVEGRLSDAIREVQAWLPKSAASDPQQIAALAEECSVRIDQLVSRWVEAPHVAKEELESRELELDNARSAAVRFGKKTQQREAELKAAQEHLTAVRLDHERIVQLAQLALVQISEEHCPVCGQEHEPAKTRARLETILADSDDLTTAEARLDRAKAAMARDRTREADARQTVERLTQQQAAIARSAEVIAAVESDLEELLPSHLGGSLVERAEAARAGLARARRSLLSAMRERAAEFEMSNRLVAASHDADAREARLSELRASVRSLEDRVRAAEKVARWLGDELVNTTTEIVETSTPLVNAFYSRLDVHPTFRRFSFRSDRRRAAGHLRPWVFDDDAEEPANGNAVQVLSAAQLNALALCLFLALNLEEGGPFAAALLDDPVQSMDDVNILSLLDVFRTLRRRRQLVLTTHDLNLATLLVRKLRPLNSSERTIYIRLTDWSPAGPRVVQDVREAAPGQRGLELLKL